MAIGEAIGLENSLAGIAGCTTSDGAEGNIETVSLIGYLLSGIPWTSCWWANISVYPTLWGYSI